VIKRKIHRGSLAPVRAVQIAFSQLKSNQIIWKKLDSSNQIK
jgi:hypothetical protein